MATKVKKEKVQETKTPVPTIGLRPLSDRLIVKKIDLEVKTKSGIILGEVEKDREIVYGKVLKVGPGFRLPDGNAAPMAVKAGDIVGFREQLPTRGSYKGEYYWILREHDLFFVVDDTDVVEKPYTLEGYELDNQVKQIR